MGVVTAYSLPRLLDTDPQLVQSGRDDIVSALFSAQQLAMVRSNAVRLTTSASQVDIRFDANGDDTFAVGESVNIAGLQYPLLLERGLTSSVATFNYDRLGRTTAGTITLSKGSVSGVVTISDSGYAF